MRLLYGIPGQPPLAAMACALPSKNGPQKPAIRFTRFARADEGAQALMAIIGNGHRERFPVEAVDNGRAFLWEGPAPLASEKLDVLTGLEQVPVCVAYDVNGVRHDEMPVNQTDFHHAVPIYEYLPGWWEDISGARTFADLPQNAQDYVRAVEKMSGARISAVGVGPSRDATVVVHPLI